PPVTVAFGGSLTVTTALPDPILVQLALETEVTVYVVLTLGATLRVAGLTAAVWVNPSDQIRFQGPVPVSAAWMFVADPLQTVAVPETVAPHWGGVGVLVFVGVAVGVLVGVSVGVSVGVLVGVEVAVGVFVGVLVGVLVGF